MPQPSRDLLLEIVKTASIGIFEFHPQLGWLKVDDTYASNLGYTKEELNSIEVWQMLIHPEHTERILSEQKVFLESEDSSTTATYPLRRKDGSYMWTRSTIFKSDGGVLIGCHVDISEEKETQLKIKETKEKAIQSETKLRNLFKAMEDVVFEMDYNGTYLNIAPTKKEFIYKTSEDITGKTLHDIFPKEQADRFLKFIQECLDENKSDKIIYSLNMNDKIVWFEGRAIPTENDKLLYIATDITKQKQADAALKESETRYQSVVSALNEGFVLQDATGAIIASNANAEKILGLSVDQMSGRTSLDPRWRSIHQDGSPFAGETHPAMATLRDGLPRQNIIMGVHKPTDELTWISINTVPLFPDNKNLPNAVVASFTDITERIQAEEELINSEANLLKVKEKAEKNEERYSRLLTNLETGIVVHAKDTSILTYNERSLEILGLTKDQMKGKNAIHLNWGFIYENGGSVPVEDYPFMRVLQTKIAQRNQILGVLNPHKGITWSLVNSFPLLNSKGEVIEITTSFVDITEQKLAKEALQKSEDRYKQLVETASDAIYLINGQGKIIDTNRVAVEMLQKSRDEIIGETMDTIDSNFSLDGFFEFWKNTPINEQIILETTHKTKKGNLIPVEISGQKFKIEGDTFYFGIARDITDRKHAEKELIEAKEKAEESENRLQLASKSAQLGIWDWNVKDNILIWDNRMFEIYGQEKNQIKNTVELWSKHLHPDDKERTLDEVNDALKGVSKFDTTFRLIRPDNKEVYVNGYGLVIRDEEDNPVRMIGINRDVTEDKIKEIELEKAKEIAEQIALELQESQKVASLASWYLDISTNQVTWSEELYKMYGFDPNLPPPPYNEQMKIFTPDSWNLLSTELLKTREQGTSYELELEMIRKGKSNGWMWVRGEAVYDDNEKVIGLRGVAQDITERKKLALDLIEAKEKAEESDRLKTEFINNMSHEIRTPMNGIIGFSSMLDEPNLSAEKRKHYTSIIQNSGHQLLRIIDDILEISRLGTKQVKVLEEQVCLNDLLLEHFSVFDIKAKENKTPLYLKKGLSDWASTILTDSNKLNKILSNLLENALKYTHEGFIEIGYYMKDQMVELYIKDTGIGIREDMHKKIFDRFSQEEKVLSKNVGGLGLGLSIAKENAELLGGKITLKSKKGKGSTFFVSIPYKQAILDTDESMLSYLEENTDQNKQTVLVAEDEEINYFYLEVLLGKVSEFDLTILHAKNGEEAIEICRDNHKVNLVLMDLKMPIMNGYDATNRIKELRPDLPIIAQTAYTAIEDKEKALSIGCDDFITKPINKTTLKEVLNKYLIEK